MNNEKWTTLLTESFQLLEKQLAEKKCKLANTRGNGYRVAEAVVKSFPGGVVPETATAAEIAARMYAAVLNDVNGIINGASGGGQLFWQVKPPKLIAFEKQRGVRPHTHLPDKQPKRVSTESSEARRENIQAMEKYYDALGYISPRSSALRGFINDVKENATFDSAEALKAVKRFINESDWRLGVNILQRHLAAERDGGAQTSASGVRDVSEFLS